MTGISDLVTSFSLSAAEKWLKIPEIVVQFPKFPFLYYKVGNFENWTTISGISAHFLLYININVITVLPKF